MKDSGHQLARTSAVNLSHETAFAEHRELNSEIARLRASLQRMTSDLDSRINQCDDYARALEHARAEEARILDECRAYYDGIVAARDERLKRISVALGQQQEEVTTLTTSRDALEAELARTRRDVDRLADDVARLRAELTAARRETTTARAEAAETRDIVAIRDAAIADLRRAFTAKEQEKLDGVDAANRTAVQREDDVRRTLARQHEDAMAALRSEHAKLIRTMEHQHDAARSEMHSHFTTRMGEVEAETKRRIAAAECEARNNQVETAAAKDESARLRAEAHAAEERRRGLEGTVTLLQNQLSRVATTPVAEAHHGGRVGYVGLELVDSGVEAAAAGRPPADGGYVGVKVQAARGPALSGGANTGDIVVAVGVLRRSPVTCVADFKLATGQLAPNDLLLLTARDASGQEREVEIRVGARMV